MDSVRLMQVIEEFKLGDFTNRTEFIVSHVRLATSIGLKYGFHGNRGDDLVGVALIELTRFPTIVHKGKLLDENIIRYLASRLHYACRMYIDKDKMYGPSRGHTNNTGVSVRRSSLDDTATYIDDNIDCILDLKAQVITNREELVLDKILDGYSDKEIARHFGWRNQSTVNHVLDDLTLRYKCAILPEVRFYLPYPDFKKSVECLDNRRLTDQTTTIKSILENNWTNHPVSLVWRYHRWQLCNFGLYSADGLRQRNIETDFDWFMHHRENLPVNSRTDMPYWFNNPKLHSAHRADLVKHSPELYTWDDNTPYFWPGYT
jgi:DNA-binding CsgD family transcriptional regulator